MSASFKIFQAAMGLLFPLLLAAQTDPTKPVPNKRPNIRVHTFDHKKFRVRLDSVGDNYLIFNAKENAISKFLDENYMTKVGDLYKMDVEIIKSVTMLKGRVVGKSALGGAIGLGILFGTIAANTMEEDDDVGQVVIAAGTGMAVGGFIGAVVGALTRKKIKINGDPTKLGELETYFYNK